MLNKTLIENYLDYFLEKPRISSEHLHHSVLTEFVHKSDKTHHTKRTDYNVGMHNVYLALREDPERIQRVSRMLQGNRLFTALYFLIFFF